jgi:hypothetical protein
MRCRKSAMQPAPHAHRKSVWQLEESVATLRTARLHAVCDLQDPAAGFDSLHPRIGRLWQIATPFHETDPRPFVEAYVRGDDLIAGYGASRQFPFATQVYWRLMHDNNDTLRMACIVSVQTDLLDTHPMMEASSELPASEVLLVSTDDSNAQAPTTLPSFVPPEAGARLVLVRIAGVDFTYAEAIDPSDFCGVKLSRSDTAGARITWRLFSHFLEKGVIRRGRLCSMLVPRKDDMQHAAHSFREFLASDLPLTT